MFSQSLLSHFSILFTPYYISPFSQFYLRFSQSYILFSPLLLFSQIYFKITTFSLSQSIFSFLIFFCFVSPISQYCIICICLINIEIILIFFICRFHISSLWGFLLVQFLPSSLLVQLHPLPRPPTRLNSAISSNPSYRGRTGRVNLSFYPGLTYPQHAVLSPHQSNQPSSVPVFQLITPLDLHPHSSCQPIPHLKPFFSSVILLPTLPSIHFTELFLILDLEI